MAATDHPLKRVVELTPNALAAWLLGVQVIHVEPRKAELTASPDPLDADNILLVTLADGRRLILHIEFQGPGSRVPMPVRLLEYKVRIYVQERDIPIISFVIYLGGAGATDTGSHTITDHNGNATVAWQYGVVRLWHMTSEELLALDHPTLAVLIGQTQIVQPERDLRQAMQRVSDNTTGELRERLMMELLLLCTNEEIAAMAEQIFKQDYGMPEPPILQKRWREGREEGRELGREEGREEGQETVILRLLRRRFGVLPDALVAQITALDSPRLLELADALLDFAQLAEVQAWLLANTPPQP